MHKQYFSKDDPPRAIAAVIAMDLSAVASSLMLSGPYSISTLAMLLKARAF
jgi:hypothetical protein